MNGTQVFLDIRMGYAAIGRSARWCSRRRAWGPEEAVLLDEPLSLVAVDEGTHGVTETIEEVEDAPVDKLHLLGAEEAREDGLAWRPDATAGNP